MSSDAIAVLASSIVLSILSLLCVLARVWAKRIKRANLGLDDWIVIIDWVIAFALTVSAEYVSGRSLVGADISRLSLHSTVFFQKFLFTSEILVTFVVGSVKVSVLLFYKKVFTVPRFHLIANILIVCCISWTLAFLLVIIFQKTPVKEAWNPTTHSNSNYNPGAMWVSMGATDIALDLAILSLPIPMIASLRLRAARKLVVAFLFGLGAFCIVASSARLVYFVRVAPLAGAPGADFTDSVAKTIIWSVIETCISIIAACLPTLLPVFKNGQGLHELANRTRLYALSFRDLLGSRRRGSVSKASKSSSELNMDHELETTKDWPGKAAPRNEHSASGRTLDQDGTSAANPDKSIRVEQTFANVIENEQ